MILCGVSITCCRWFAFGAFAPYNRPPAFAQFILDYPEFANASQAQFNLYLNRASQFINAAWGPLSTGTDPTQYTQADIGTELVIGHFLARAQFRAIAVANGGPAMRV